MRRKGQGAMEYLMTYGWALLVIIVVGAALYSLGVLDPATYQQKGCRGLQYFHYQDHKINTTHFQIQILNANQDVTISALQVATTPATQLTVSDSDIQEGDKFIITGNITDMNFTVGSSYNNDITITYNVIDGILGNVDTASCSGTTA